VQEQRKNSRWQDRQRQEKRWQNRRQINRAEVRQHNRKKNVAQKCGTRNGAQQRVQQRS